MKLEQPKTITAKKCTHCKKIMTETDLNFGKKSEPKLCVTCFTGNG